MLTNYITDEDLFAYHPTLINYLEEGQTDFSVQIAMAFDVVLDDLRNRKIDVKKLHIPLDLNRDRDSSEKQHSLNVLSVDSNYTSNFINSLEGYRRFVFEIKNLQNLTNCQMILEGSNDILDSILTAPESWFEIGRVEKDSIGIITAVFQEEYKYYRFRIILQGESPSISFTASIVEVYPDRWIIWKTIQLISENLMREDNDTWSIRAANAKIRYDSAITSTVYVEDTNADNLPDEEPKQNEITFKRSL